MICSHHEALVGPTTARTQAAGRGRALPHRHGRTRDRVARLAPPLRPGSPASGDESAGPYPWGRVLAAAVAAAILGFYFPSLVTHGRVTAPPATVCDGATVQTGAVPGC